MCHLRGLAPGGELGARYRAATAVVPPAGLQLALVPPALEAGAAVGGVLVRPAPVRQPVRPLALVPPFASPGRAGSCRSAV